MMKYEWIVNVVTANRMDELKTECSQKQINKANREMLHYNNKSKIISHFFSFLQDESRLRQGLSEATEQTHRHVAAGLAVFSDRFQSWVNGAKKSSKVEKFPEL